MKRSYPLIRMALLFALLLGSLTLVVWRQGEALKVLRRLDTVRAERVIAEAHRASLKRRVEQLESRGRVASVARDRLGMRLPTGSEIVILPLGDAVVGVLAREEEAAPRSTALARHAIGAPASAGADPERERDEG